MVEGLLSAHVADEPDAGPDVEPDDGQRKELPLGLLGHFPLDRLVGVDEGDGQCHEDEQICPSKCWVNKK